MLAQAWLLETLAVIGLGRWVKRKQDLELVYGLGPRAPRHIPVLDRFTLRLAGNPSSTAKFASERLVKMIRGFVNTKSFEHLVVALLNKQSKLHRFAKQPPTTDARFYIS